MDPGHFLRRMFALCAAIFVVAAIWPQLGRSQPTGMQPEAEKLLRRMATFDPDEIWQRVEWADGRASRG